MEYVVKVNEHGTRQWFVNGKLHREDGPAVEYASGTRQWYVNGLELTEQEFLARTKQPCVDKIIEIDGVKYRLVAV